MSGWFDCDQIKYRTHATVHPSMNAGGRRAVFYIQLLQHLWRTSTELNQ